MTSRNEQRQQSVPISTEGRVAESRRVIKGIENPLTDLEGTPNQVIVTPVGDKVVLSTPQDIDQNADVTFDSLTIDKIVFSLIAGVNPSEGELSWNADDGTLDLGMPGGNVTLQIGQEMLTPRAKATGSDIDNGQLVYVSGATGAVPHMTLAKADAAATSTGTIAMATEDIIQNQSGYYTAFGLVRDIDTSAFSVGDVLYLSATTAGGFTNVKPAQPNYAVKIGVVIRDHATEGIVLVTIEQRTNNYSNIRGLTANSILFANSDGFIDQDNPAFVYDGTHAYLSTDSSKWFFGGGNDLSIFYDGTDAWIKTDEVAASDLKIDCGTNKTFELVESVYRDENFSGFATSPAVSAPDIISWDSGTIDVRAFDGNATTEQLMAGAEIQHDYKQGSDLIFHIHWAPTTAAAGNVKWQIDYTIERDDTGTVASGSLSAVDAADGTAWVPTRVNIGTVTGTSLLIGDQVGIRLYRDPSDVADTYSDDAALAFTFGYHYEVDTMGSRQIGTK